MRLMIRACCLTLALLTGTLWPALPGLGAGASEEHGLEGYPPLPKDAVAQCLQDQVNGTRAAHGLHALPEIPSLLQVAQRHSDRMAAEQWMQHSTDEVFSTLPPGWLAYGENVVYGKTCEQMFEALLGSESHRDAILRPDFNVSGIAVSTGSDGWIYATMVFLNLPELPPPPLPPAQPPPSPSPSPPSSSSPSPAPPGSPSEPLPAVSPSAEPVATISLLPSRSEAHPAEEGSLSEKSQAKNPRRLGQSSATKAEQKDGGRPVSATEAVSGESSVWVLDEWVPGSLPPEPEPDPSQMIFELEEAPGG